MQMACLVLLHHEAISLATTRFACGLRSFAEFPLLPVLSQSHVCLTSNTKLNSE
jgi:hypothetical protein